MKTHPRYISYCTYRCQNSEKQQQQKKKKPSKISGKLIRRAVYSIRSELEGKIKILFNQFSNTLDNLTMLFVITFWYS